MLFQTTFAHLSVVQLICFVNDQMLWTLFSRQPFWSHIYILTKWRQKTSGKISLSLRKWMLEIHLNVSQLSESVVPKSLSWGFCEKKILQGNKGFEAANEFLV